MIPRGPIGARNRDRPSLYRMAALFDPPPLRTRQAQPSWVNRSGSIDRSACVELRASDVWRFAEFATIAHPCHHGARNPGLVHGYREAASEIIVAARFLARVQRNRRPRHLQGDLRTTKSNAMRPSFLPPLPPGEGGGEGLLLPPLPPGEGRGEGLLLPPLPPGEGRGEGLQRKHIRIHRPTPALNPNKGAPQTKFLGLWEHWSQTIRIERWRLHDRLAQHFLICPNSPSLLSPSPLGRGVRGEGSSTSCLHKVRKLFMPMCTRDEARDADLAEAWINQLDARCRITCAPLPASLMAQRASLLDRYRLLLTTGRRLVCRKCLGLRYGEVRKKLS